MADTAPLGIVLVSGFLLYGIPDGASGFPWLMAWSCAHALVVFFVLRRREHKDLPWRKLLLLFALSRIPLLTSFPVMENDFWRYLWDGHVLASGVNPYLHAPLSPALDGVHLWIRERVAFGDIGTIYPPFAQFVFAATNLVAGDRLIALKVVFLGFELLAFYGIWSWLCDRGRSAESLWLLFHPLFLKEIVNSAHLDSLAVGTAVMAVVSLRRKWWEAPLWLALSVLSKLWALVLVPVLFFHLPRGRRIPALLLLGLSISTAYLPFLDAGPALWDGTRTFARYWIFNPGLHRIFLFFLDETVLKILSGVTVFAVSVVTARKFPPERAAVWAVGALILLSPVINAWYVLWILPFSLLAGAWPWLVFGVVVTAGYSWFWDPELAPWFRGAQWVIFLLATAVYLKRKCEPVKEDTCPSSL